MIWPIILNDVLSLSVMFIPLEPGDIIATGTNHGGLNPFHDGDTVELECEGMGRLKSEYS